VGVTLRVKNIDTVASAIYTAGTTRPRISTQVVISGPAAAYALVWEYGSLRLSKPGPKTQWGMNPDIGEFRILTKHAPQGYIRVNKHMYRQFVREEMAKIMWGRVALKNISSMVESVLTAAGARCADLIANTAPIDTGALRDAIRAVPGTGPGEGTPAVDTSVIRPVLHV
jgi:hypothetical protein